jgi:hypothetical protein
MTQPIGSSPHTPAPASTNVPALAQQMRIQASLLAEQLQKALDDPSLSEQASFLKEVANNGSQLNQTVEQANLIR